MAQPIERILVRHLGSRLAVPLFLVDTDGTLVFYNEAAEQLLGRRFDDAGEMSFDAWTSAFAVRDDAGQPLEIDQLPLVKALRERRPAHARFDITGAGSTCCSPTCTWTTCRGSASSSRASARRSSCTSGGRPRPPWTCASV